MGDGAVVISEGRHQGGEAARRNLRDNPAAVPPAKGWLNQWCCPKLTSRRTPLSANACARHSHCSKHQENQSKARLGLRLGIPAHFEKDQDGRIAKTLAALSFQGPLHVK